MNVLKVLTEAVTSSFRYGHVQIGKLPTYEVPPPATIYGHLAGVLGEWFDPKGLQFAYVFRHAGKGTDLETAQPIERGSGKPTLRREGWDYPVNVECAPNPQRREFLLRPRLTLYLRGPHPLLRRFQAAFPNPVYAYVLGRSQDLATCLSASPVDLEESVEGFFSHTILPYSWRKWVSPGSTVHLPTAIDYYHQRAAVFEVYLQVLWPPLRLYRGSQDTISRDQLPATFPVDRGDNQEFLGRKLSRGLIFHPLVGPGAPP
jgi:CRISPR-associated protein Cas5t